jgi:glycosyltransferase involved in cell wall biosynthesis
MGWQPEQPGNGLDRVYHALSTHLPNAGVEMQGLVAGSEEVAQSSEGRVTAVSGTSFPGRLWGMRRAVRTYLANHSPDLIASHFAPYTVPVLDLIRDLPLVVHFHGPWALESQIEGESAWKVWGKEAIERLVYRRATRFIVLSEAFRTVLTESYGIPDSKVTVIPGGTNVSHFQTGVSRPEARQRLEWPSDRPIVLSVRRLTPRMGLENLISSIHEVRRSIPDVLIHIAGKGPLARPLMARIESEGLSEHVRLLGYLSDEDLPYAYRAANLTVVPSVALEGFGLITAESLAAGTPVLVTPVGGLPETVRGLSSALVLANPSAEALADGLRAVLSGDLRLPTSEACQKYAQENLSWATVANRVGSVYAEVTRS